MGQGGARTEGSGSCYWAVLHHERCENRRESETVLARHENRVPEMKGDIGRDCFVGDGSQDKKEDKVAGDDGQCPVVDEDIEIS